MLNSNFSTGFWIVLGAGAALVIVSLLMGLFRKVA